MARSLAFWVAAMPLVVQVGLFLWTADRGLDLTDEGFYLLNYLHWRQMIASVSLFGAYFELPFRLLGEQVSLMRVFGLALLASCSAWLACRVLQFGRSSPIDRTWLVGLAGCAGGLCYYGYLTTLRSPSYNLLVLICIMASTALLLMLCDPHIGRRRAGGAAFAYGMVLGACTVSKTTSAFALLVCHAMFAIHCGALRRASRWYLAGLAGFFLNLLLLLWAQPEIFTVLRNGLRFAVLLDNRFVLPPLLSILDSIERGAHRLLVPLMAALLAVVAMIGVPGRHRSERLFGAVVGALAIALLTIQLQGYGKSWWVLMLACTGVFWTAVHLTRSTGHAAPAGGRPGALTVLLFALPVCFSIGTNNSLAAHTQMAMGFGYVALLLPLQRLTESGRLHPAALPICVAMLAMPTLVTQIRSLSDVSYTYRLSSGILSQDQAVLIGSVPAVLRVDTDTRDTLTALLQGMEKAGFQPGDRLLDATGEGPGLIFALGAVPVGAAWILGGYPGSAAAAEFLVGRVPEAQLRQAWMLTAEGTQRSILSLPQAVRNRLDGKGPVHCGVVPLKPSAMTGAQGPKALHIWCPVSGSR